VKHFSSSVGDDGKGDAIPRLGDFQEALTVFNTAVRDLRPTPIQLYGGTLALVAIGLAALFRQSGVGLEAPIWALLVLSFVALFAEKQPVRLSENAEIVVTVLPILFAAVTFGPLAAMLVAAVGLLADLRAPYTRWVVWTSTRAISAGLAGGAAWLVLGESSSFGVLAAAVLAATVTEALVDAMLASLTVSVRGGGSCREFFRLARPVVISSVSIYTPALVLLVYAYREVSPWSLLLFFGPAFAVHTLYRLYREQQEVTDELTHVNGRLERANISFASALVAALDARDRYTAGHSAAVAVYARDIAERLQLSEEEQQLAHLCGLVHDIGKVGLPPGILEKPGALTLEERRIMEEHSVIGERILANVDDYAQIATIVRHHHERMDGNGYPDGLPGDEIPLISRIIAVADAYNAMTSGRPYRDAMPTRVARFRLAQAASTQFDTTIVAAFEAILAGSKESYLSGLSADFGIEVQRQPAMRPLAIAQPA
jgi:putative nucleotidyltransferase with HDIG domain